MMTDPIADMITRIRNANANQAEHVTMPGSKAKLGIARALKKEGFITDFRHTEDNKQGLLRIYLKYGPDGEKLISTIRRVSRPGRRIYRKVDELKLVLDGLGVAIVSTSKGILSDRDCRKLGLGGEVLCEVW